MNERFRSGLERQVAAQLRRRGLRFAYEGEKVEYIKPAREAKYTPDFTLVTKTGKKLYIETKGLFITEDRAKHRLIRDQRPDLDIRFVFSNSKQKISKGSPTTYASWCTKHGFLYADKFIPEEWLDE